MLLLIYYNIYIYISLERCVFPSSADKCKRPKHGIHLPLGQLGLNRYYSFPPMNRYRAAIIRNSLGNGFFTPFSAISQWYVVWLS